jgi:hypothetical protein
VIVTTDPATGLGAVDVTTYLAAGFSPVAVVVIGAVEPVKEPVVAVTTWTVPFVLDVVKSTVATPLAFVVLVPVSRDPPFVLVQVTVIPAVPTELPFASANRADTTTLLPATGLELLDVTRYLVAAPAIVPTFPLDPVSGPSVAVNAYVTPAVVLVVNTTVAMPLALVVDVAVANDPPAPVLVHETI